MSPLILGRRSPLLVGVPAFVHGFDFRGSSGYVTDPTNCQVVNSSSVSYPFTNQGVTFGWEQGITGSIDRSNTIDARLAGIGYRDNASTKSDFRIDLPAAGTYSITLGIGDAVGGGTQLVEILDTTTSLRVIGPTGTASGHFLDAAGTDFSAAAWPGGNVTYSATFATTICRVRIGQGSGTGGTFTTLAHVFLTRTA